MYCSPYDPLICGPWNSSDYSSTDEPDDDPSECVRARGKCGLPFFIADFSGNRTCVGSGNASAGLARRGGWYLFSAQGEISKMNMTCTNELVLTNLGEFVNNLV